MYALRSSYGELQLAEPCSYQNEANRKYWSYKVTRELKTADPLRTNFSDSLPDLPTDRLLSHRMCLLGKLFYGEPVTERGRSADAD